MQEGEANNTTEPNGQETPPTVDRSHANDEPNNHTDEQTRTSSRLELNSRTNEPKTSSNEGADECGKGVVAQPALFSSLESEGDDQSQGICEQEVRAALEPLFNQKYMILADTELFIRMDYSRTILNSLSPQSRWLPLISIAISRVYFRKLGRIFLTILVLALGYALWIYLRSWVFIPWLYHTMFVLALTYPFLFICIMQPDVFKLGLCHFETLYLMSNIVAAILAFEVCIGWRYYPHYAILFYVSTYAGMVFVNSWPVSFVRYSLIHHELSNLFSRSQSRSPNQGNDGESGNASRVYQSPLQEYLPRIKSAWQQELEENHDAGPDVNISNNDDWHTFEKCKSFYKNLERYIHEVPNFNSKMIRRWKVNHLLGYSSFVVITLGIVAPIYLLTIIETDAIQLYQAKEFNFLRSKLTAVSVFRTCAFNTLLYFMRRIVMMFFYPIKLNCLSRKIIRLPLVSAWSSFVSDETFARMCLELKGKGFIPKQANVNFNVNPPRSESFNDVQISQNQIAEDELRYGDIPPQGCADILYEWAKSAICPYESNSWTSRQVILFTPGRYFFFQDLSNSLSMWLFGFRISEMLRGLNKKAYIWYSASNILIPFCFLLDITQPRHPILSIFFFTASCAGVVSITIQLLGLSKEGVFLAVKTFETAYFMFNSLVLFIVLSDYISPYTFWWRYPGCVFVFFLAIKTSLLDTRPINYKRFNHNLEVLHKEFTSNSDYDPFVLYTIAQLAHTIRKEVLSEALMSSHGSSYMPRNAQNADQSTQFFENNHLPPISWRSRWKMIRFFSLGALETSASGVLIALFLWVELDGEYIYGPTNRTLNFFVGAWTSKTIIRATLFNMFFVMARRTWSLAKNPHRCVCYERRVVKIPLVDSPPVR